MALVLVHGNPESSEVWDLVADHLSSAGHDPIRLSPPGFGAPVPDGFGAKVLDYRDWLVDELSRIEGPADLVGHDWGGAHVLNVAMIRPDLIRSWCSDSIGLFDADYVWHKDAQAWQTEGEGEAWIAKWLGQGTEELPVLLTQLGCDSVIARRMSARYDPQMGECILRLYRSAAQPAMAKLGAGLEGAAKRPGLAIVPTADHYVGTLEQRRRSAARAGAQVEHFDGFRHWWMTEDGGRRAATVLTEFWASLS